MKINTTRFGELEIQEKDIFHFSQGLPGFSEEKQFVLIPYRAGSPFFFLQSLADPNLSFLVVDPFAVFSDYEFQLDDQVVAVLALSPENAPCIYNIVTVTGKVEDMTANLLAPLVINRQTKTGLQVVLEKSNYTTRHRLFPAGKTVAAAQGGE
jgi:flagellar assembly factor FliW